MANPPTSPVWIEVAGDIQFMSHGAIVPFRIQPWNIRLGMHVPDATPTQDRNEILRKGWLVCSVTLEALSQEALARAQAYRQ